MIGGQYDAYRFCVPPAQASKVAKKIEFCAPEYSDYLESNRSTSEAFTCSSTVILLVFKQVCAHRDWLGVSFDAEASQDGCLSSSLSDTARPPF